MYEQNKYSASIDYLEKAFEKRVFHNPLHAAALLKKAIEDWQDKRWGEAIKNTINSLLTEKSFAASYNLALMAWQMEKMEQSKQSIELSLTQQERDIVANWRNILTLLVQNKIKAQQLYGKYIENAGKILSDDINSETQFVAPDYQ
jgi:tetratricopeptide (TPR) repeat protein